MAKIVSKRGRAEPQPAQEAGAPTEYSPTIVVNPDGSWSFPEAEKQDDSQGNWPFPTGQKPTTSVDPNDEEVLKRTTEGVDINYINMEDC